MRALTTLVTGCGGLSKRCWISNRDQTIDKPILSFYTVNWYNIIDVDILIYPCSTSIIVCLTVSEVDPGGLQHCATGRSWHMLCLPSKPSAFVQSCLVVRWCLEFQDIADMTLNHMLYIHVSWEVCAATFSSNNNCSNDENWTLNWSALLSFTRFERSAGTRLATAQPCSHAVVPQHGSSSMRSKRGRCGFSRRACCPVGSVLDLNISFERRSRWMREGTLGRNNMKEWRWTVTWYKDVQQRLNFTKRLIQEQCALMQSKQHFSQVRHQATARWVWTCQFLCLDMLTRRGVEHETWFVPLLHQIAVSRNCWHAV